MSTRKAVPGHAHMVGDSGEETETQIIMMYEWQLVFLCKR
jgi:hypothetical protein